MYALLGFAVFVSLVVGTMTLLRHTPRFVPEKIPYRVKRTLFNHSERAFYLELTRQLPEGFSVFSKVRVIDFVESGTGKRFALWRNAIFATQVDFLICDTYFTPVVAIELARSGRQTPAQNASIAFLKSVCEEANLPLVSMPVGVNIIEPVVHIMQVLKR